ncbi:MAG: DNA polymerase III subunit beta [Pseudomonadota bacterium]|nr:DNA polymerase III subunit beta [Pseudomonadota bacterium]
MNIETNREILMPVLNRVSGVVERRQTLPILGNFLISASDKSAQITGTDLEIEVRSRFPAVVHSAGDTTVPARKFLDICRALPDGADISMRVEKDRLSLLSGRSRFALSTLPATDYPAMEPTTVGESFSIAQGKLKYLLEKAAFAMAHQDVRYYLNGLLLELTSDRLIAVATDGHRLAKVEETVEQEVGREMQVILPRKSVLELSRLLSATDEVVRLDISENAFRTQVNDTVLMSKLVDGRYPDYERVIPKLADRIAVTDRDSLRQALVRTSILSNEKYKGVRMSFTEGQLRLQAHNPEQEEAEEEIELDYTQEPTAIGFNVGYLMDVLNVLDDEQVELQFGDSNTSALIRNKGKEQETYVVMPMRL